MDTPQATDMSFIDVIVSAAPFNTEVLSTQLYLNVFALSVYNIFDNYAIEIWFFLFKFDTFVYFLQKETPSFHCFLQIYLQIIYNYSEIRLNVFVKCLRQAFMLSTFFDNATIMIAFKVFLLYNYITVCTALYWILFNVLRIKLSSNYYYSKGEYHYEIWLL